MTDNTDTLIVNAELIHLINNYKVTKISGKFDGADDDGQVQDIKVKTSDKITIPDEQRDVIERFVVDAISDLSPGWELDGGSSGTVHISFTDPNSADISMSMTQRFLESSTINVLYSLETE